MNALTEHVQVCVNEGDSLERAQERVMNKIRVLLDMQGA